MCTHISTSKEPGHLRGLLTRLSLVALAALLALSVLACAPDHAADAQAIEAAFPMFDELGLEYYDEACDAIIYERGAFGSGGECSSPIVEAADVQPLEDQAREDMARIAAAASSAATLEDAYLERDPTTGTISSGSFTLVKPSLLGSKRYYYYYYPGVGREMRNESGETFESHFVTKHVIDDDWYVEY
jgi:hypothetical protein